MNRIVADLPLTSTPSWAVWERRLTHPAPSHTLHIMTSLLRTGLNGHLPAPSEKRFLISYPLALVKPR